MDTKELIHVANLLVCLAIAWSCFCRLAMIDAQVLRRVAWQFILKGTAAVACAFQLQLFGTWAGLGTLIFSSALLASMVLGAGRWRHGPPADVCKGRP